MRIAIAIAVAGLCLAANSLDEMEPPISGLRTIDVKDVFDEIHNGHPHEAIDIMEPRGTPVHAVVTGKIGKLFLSKAGGITIYEIDRDELYCYYYAHLDRYADKLREGASVERGEIIGYVGSTGNANAKAPHLHFAVMRLGPEKRWWKGEALNPYQALIAAVRRTQAQ